MPAKGGRFVIDYEKLEKSFEHLARQYENYRDMDDRPSLSDLDREAIRESVVQRFETCYDCLWKVLKRHLVEELGLPEVPNSPKPLFRIAFENALLPEGVEPWLRYANARIGTAHDYSGDKAAEALAMMAEFLGHAEALFHRLAGGVVSPMTTRLPGVTPEQEALLRNLLVRCLPGREVWAFGSRVKGTSRPASDLDLAILIPPGGDVRLAALREALEESDLPFRVDLLEWESLPESFRREIAGHRVRLQEAEPGMEKGS